MALVLASDNAIARPSPPGQVFVLTIDRTHLLVTADGNGTFVWELRRWYYRDAMAPPAMKLYHRIRNNQQANGGSAKQHALQL